MPLKIRPLVAEDRADWGQMWGDYLSVICKIFTPKTPCVGRVLAGL